jgi:hypothetical protein
MVESREKCSELLRADAPIYKATSHHNVIEVVVRYANKQHREQTASVDPPKCHTR